VQGRSPRKWPDLVGEVGDHQRVGFVEVSIARPRGTGSKRAA
jgi:hypothetical protein